MSKKGLNKAIIAGTVAEDPKSRSMHDGSIAVNLTVVTTENYQDKEYSEWHKIALYGSAAKLAGGNIKKGHFVYLEGKIKTRKWKDREGVDRYITEIVADNLLRLDSNGSNSHDLSREDIPF